MRSLFFLSLFSVVAAAAPVRENIGELKIHDVLLRPYASISEPQDGNFSIGESSFALRWELEEVFHGVVRVGPRDLVNPVARYTPTVDDDLVLVEAFAEFQSPYGRFRLGRLPLEFGLEGSWWERELIFPRSLLFQKRVVALRDVGFSYSIMHNNFFTEAVIHNGEGDDDVDGRSWYTAKWGYQTKTFEIGVAGQTGSTKPISTSSSGDTLASVDVNKNAHWRMGGFFIDYNPKGWRISLEAYGGDREQEHNVHRFGTGHFDASYQWTRRIFSHIRYDYFDPDTKKSSNAQQNASAAISFSNPTRSSNLILIGTKVFEEGAKVANDELRLIWSLSPSGIVHFSSTAASSGL